MELSGIGEIADKCWLEIPKQFPFVILHEHIVMPNHVHGLIEIAKNDVGCVLNDIVISLRSYLLSFQSNETTHYVSRIT